MHEIFLNYRTKGGKDVAYMCQHHLSARFGPDSVFIARNSIDPGQTMEVLLQAPRRCHVLLALIDAEWLDAPDRREPGRRALDNPDDWVRREIEEALSGGALIVPVFIGRKVEQLDPRRLPRSITELADYQYTRVEQHRIEEDLTRLGDRLVRRVPALAALDSRTPAEAPVPDERPASVHNEHQSGGIGQVGGSVGTYINDARGPLHTGPGDQINGPQINGDGTNHIAGDNHGGIRQGFGTRTPRGGDER
ncbi:TIR domain-containing protein [Streptomyces sp. SID13726]|uniref:TIR domain-containing protein n=1 Tax=Streptomyces sp. SID13726 TaxID=2706058 RepID=UPI0013B8E310|nr:TIR domain-containing protein [Streptomyces sp. SID13726]NEB05209.1 TIR domain-containing protein [Streptomyces sp. SID13726]